MRAFLNLLICLALGLVGFVAGEYTYQLSTKYTAERV
jgi:hypothetical protein